VKPWYYDEDEKTRRRIERDTIEWVPPEPPLIEDTWFTESPLFGYKGKTLERKKDRK